jgi:ADP-heptose:LPS heptosyltransferase
MKILAIQFRYLGDAVLMTPALRAIKDHFSDCELHVLVAEEVTPLLRHLPWLDRVWAFPRTRGKAKFTRAWPIIRALRRERFDRSVDFSGNDRGAIVSLMCGARQRLAPFRPGGFFGRRFCYTQTVPASQTIHQALYSFLPLSAWGIVTPAAAEMEIHADPALAKMAEQLLPQPAILCHLASSQSNRQWPISHWAEFYRAATAAGHKIIFSTGPSPRERALLDDLKKIAPDAPALPPMPDLAGFLAVIKQARLFISGDTGPLHFAAGLGVPTIALFGPSYPSLWAPAGKQHRFLQVENCACGPNTSSCRNATHCMATISPAAVLELLPDVLAPSAAAVCQTTKP